MPKMGEVGIATAAAFVAVLAVAGGAVGGPLAVDTFADQQPDGPLYALERAGERIKELANSDNPNWHLDRARERTEEYLSMNGKKITGNHVELIDDSGERLINAIGSAEGGKELEKAREVINWHISILENLREKENVPGVAKVAISLAISTSARGKAVLADVTTGELPPGRLSESAREEMRNQAGDIREKARSLKDEIKENLGRGTPLQELVQNIEIGTVTDLAAKAREMAEEMKGESTPPVIEEARKRLSAAVRATVDNSGLERARAAVKKHIRVLENIWQEVPEVARPAIGRALVYSQWQERVLENIENKFRGRRIPPGILKEELENRAISPESLIAILENKRLPPGVFKEMLENREISFEDLRDLLEGRRISPGVLKEILESREISPEDLMSLLEGIGLPRGTLKEILENRGISPEDLENILEKKRLPFVHKGGELPRWMPGPPPWAGREGPPGGPGETGGEEGEGPEGPGYILLGGVRIRNPPATYSINPANDWGLGEADVIREIQEAFETWDAHTSVELFGDSTETTDKSGFQQDGENVVSFAPLEDAEMAAETRIWYDEEAKNVLEFDIILNSEAEWGIDPDGEGPETISAYDVRNIATHEAGHTLVLKDVQDEDYGHLTMYYRSEPGSSVKISLEEGDIVGLHELYGD